MKRLIGALAGWKGYALLAALMLAAGFGGGWQVRDWIASADALKAAEQAERDAQRAVTRARAQSAVTSQIEQAGAAAQAEIQYRTHTLIREVPVYVTPSADARCSVPGGFVRLHDAAAAGRPVPEPAGVADDAPSGVALSAVASTIVGNYGACEANARQLTDLQEWIRRQVAVTNGE